MTSEQKLKTHSRSHFEPFPNDNKIILKLYCFLKNRLYALITKKWKDRRRIEKLGQISLITINTRTTSRIRVTHSKYDFWNKKKNHIVNIDTRKIATTIKNHNGNPKRVDEIPKTNKKRKTMQQWWLHHKIVSTLFVCIEYNKRSLLYWKRF